MGTCLINSLISLDYKTSQGKFLLESILVGHTFLQICPFHLNFHFCKLKVVCIILF